MKRQLCCCVLFVSAVTLSIGAGGAPRAAPTGPCGTARTSRTRYAHVIWILEENHSYGKIIGNPDAPYINALARECGLATNYHNISHPSLPNYIGMTSGLPLSRLRRFSGDCSPSSTCSTSAPSILGQSPSWKAYDESMPSNCDKRGTREYAVRHNPALYFTRLTGCATKDLPYTRLAPNLRAGTVPAFSFIMPNLIHDMHDGTVAQGDAWLKHHLPTILNSTEYRSGRTAVFITWDEGEGGKSRNCATNTRDIGCHVATIVISPTTKPDARSGVLFNHYSLLRTAEELLHLPALGEAKRAHSMRSAFRL